MPRELEDLIAAGIDADAHDRFDLLDAIRGHDHLDDLSPEAAGAAAYLLAGSGDPGDLGAVARLSLRAHQAGVAAAGRLHAEASDKIALYTGRPQPYGTVMLEQHGEIVQPPVDPRTGDDERLALGIPSLAEMTERMRQATFDLAVERGTQSATLPQGQRWCRVWTSPDSDALRERMAREGQPAWADGDVLTLVHDGAPFVAEPVFTAASWPVGDLQVLQVRVERLDEAVITYRFTPADGSGGFRFGGHDGRFRGAASPPELGRSDPLIGSTYDHAIESDAFGEPRAVTVYRPPGHQVGADIPVVYATDGNMITPYLRRVDASIVAGECPPVVVVAAHSAGFHPVAGNLRAAEYLPGFDRSRFEAHQRFFIDELSDWAEAELGVPSTPELRGVFGCSDGGGHALMVARMHPSRFGHAFAYSTGMPPEMTEPWTADHPFIHLCAGTLEGAFFQATQSWAGFLMLQPDARYHFTERVAGHDLIQWAEEFPRALTRAWGQTP